jgi:hypothetical protein
MPNVDQPFSWRSHGSVCRHDLFPYCVPTVSLLCPYCVPTVSQLCPSLFL